MSFLLVLVAVLLSSAGVVLLRKSLRKSWYWRVSVVVTAMAMFLASAGLLLGFLVLHLGCGEYVFPYQPSPDQQRLARVTEFDCGATTPFTSYVGLRVGGFAGVLPLPRWERTVVIVEQDPRLVQLIWKGNRNLTVRYPPPVGDNPHVCNTTWRDVHITCETYEPDNAPLPQMSPNRWLW